MAISTLTYTREATINDTYDLLVKLESFASGLGWSTEIQHDKAWTDTGGGVYGWTAGAYDFLELKSTGYGAQSLCYRFRWQVVVAATRGLLEYSLTDPTSSTYSTASATYPHIQDQINTESTYDQISLPDAAYTDGAYFFGNSRFICVICGLFSDAQAIFMFGLPDLLPELQIESDISFLWPAGYYFNDSAAYHWDNLKSNPTNWKGAGAMLNQSTVYQYYKAKVQSGVSNNITANIVANNDTAPAGDFNNLQYMLKYNSFSDKRIGAQPTVILKDTDTGQWFPAGVMPFIFIPYGGLSIASEIVYGSDTYKAFPFVQQSYNYGYGFRTA